MVRCACLISSFSHLSARTWARAAAAAMTRRSLFLQKATRDRTYSTRKVRCSLTRCEDDDLTRFVLLEEPLSCCGPLLPVLLLHLAPHQPVGRLPLVILVLPREAQAGHEVGPVEVEVPHLVLVAVGRPEAGQLVVLPSFPRLSARLRPALLLRHPLEQLLVHVVEARVVVAEALVAAAGEERPQIHHFRVLCRVRGAAEDLAAVLVIPAPLARIAKYAVSVGERLEALRRQRIVRVLVRMQLERQLAVGFLDFVAAGVAGHAQQLIVADHGRADAAEAEATERRSTEQSRRRRSGA
eukprot:scaffold541_cov312-Pinguiococcus_pyrenoidosus.AAC.2